MDQTTCANKECGAEMLAGDVFCGVCGARVAEQPGPKAFITWGPARVDGTDGRKLGNGKTAGDTTTPTPPTGGGVIGSPDTTPPDEPEGLPFFSHEPARPPGPFNSVTRFLCAAAYLDRGFANTVILNLLVMRKAVAPSVNFDVGPVLRHCLRARRYITVRDVVMVLIILGGLIVKPLPAFDVLLYTIALGGVVPNDRRRRGGFWTQLVLLLVTVITGGLAILLTAVLVLGSIASSVRSGQVSMAAVTTGLTILMVTFAVLVGALAAAEFVYLRITARALAAGAWPGAESHRVLSPATEQRITLVERAQWGNVTLHGGWFPFIGAGAQTEAHWSIATSLRNQAADDHNWEKRLLGDSYIRVDPVDLQQFIGRRLWALNDPALPENERIAALTVSNRLVGTGVLFAGNPLLDPVLRAPYSHASQEAVEALIRHPQARLRYYQQVSVNDQSPVVMSHDHREVIGGVDQEVAVSAFVYAAVEGRMLYLQFVLTALPQIDSSYRVYRLWYATSVLRTLTETFRRLFPTLRSAVPGIYRAFRLWRKEQAVEKLYQLVPGSNYGADISVRELGTADYFNRYMQELDVEKYNMILSQAILDAVTEYLAIKGIDTSAFTGIAQNIINNINNGNVYGDLSQQAGHGNSINNPPNS